MSVYEYEEFRPRGKPGAKRLVILGTIWIEVDPHVDLTTLSSTHRNGERYILAQWHEDELEPRKVQ